MSSNDRAADSRSAWDATFDLGGLLMTYLRPDRLYTVRLLSLDAYNNPLNKVKVMLPDLLPAGTPLAVVALPKEPAWHHGVVKEDHAAHALNVGLASTGRWRVQLLPLSAPPAMTTLPNMTVTTFTAPAPNLIGDNTVAFNLGGSGVVWASRRIQDYDTFTAKFEAWMDGPNSLQFFCGATSLPTSVTNINTAVGVELKVAAGTPNPILPSPGYSAFSVTATYANISPDRLFNGGLTTGAALAGTYGAEHGGRVGLIYPSPECLAAYTIVGSPNQAGKYPTSFRIEGSNDGTTWTTLDARDGVTWTLGGDTKTFYLPTMAATSYTMLSLYVVAVNSGWTGSWCDLMEIVFYTAPAPAPAVYRAVALNDTSASLGAVSGANDVLTPGAWHAVEVQYARRASPNWRVTVNGAPAVQYSSPTHETWLSATSGALYGLAARGSFAVRNFAIEVPGKAAWRAGLGIEEMSG